ncbi:MAG: 1-acyl-sn-glycerol-3-phosphate acyltransferase [Rhodospirillaceae bacterium]|nr:1-acyl-sn-glycerol-3-phosphate acyltransferase [Rhodospirillaceae bacterium]
MISIITLMRFLAITACLAPLQVFLMLFRIPLSRRLPMIWHRTICRVFRFRLELHGTLSRQTPILFVCNHTSYLDIPVLGAVLPGCFVAKAEVKNWPLFGFLSKLQRTVFVERRVTRTGHHRDEMTTRMENGDNLILFPEGTSNDGNRVLPFKSAFFAIADKEIDGKPICVQPVSVSYTHLDGLPMGRRYRPYFAWYGDMDLASHLWSVAGIGKTTITVQFHEPVIFADFGSRKALANHCWQVVSTGVSDAISGRLKLKRKRRWWPTKRLFYDKKTITNLSGPA